jgi:hypothetical protein
MVVLGHLAVLRVLHDLQKPEPDRERAKGQGDTPPQYRQAAIDSATIFSRSHV